MKPMMTFLKLLVSFGLLCTACTPGSGGDVIRIGLEAELSGGLPAIGASCKNAAELAVQQINAAGGLAVGGKKYLVELVIKDNQADDAVTSQITQELAGDPAVIAIVGPNASHFAIPAAEVAEASRVLLISPWSTNPDTTLDPVTREPRKYVIRAAFVDAFQGQVVAHFALEILQAQRAAVLFDMDSEYNQGIAEFFKQIYQEQGGQVVAYETYHTGDTDFSSQLSRIQAAAPDVIFLPNYYTDVPLQIQQAHQLGILAPFLGSDSWGSPELLSRCGAECEGYYFSTHYAPDSTNPAAIRFVEDYQKAYGALPDDVAALTYDSFGLLWQALQSAGELDRQKVNDAVHEIVRYDGVTGTLMFQQGSGDPIKSAVILQIRSGKFTWFANLNP
jgi:branched-chain amino acid transport system substrate-binding protein